MEVVDDEDVVLVPPYTGGNSDVLVSPYTGGSSDVLLNVYAAGAVDSEDGPG